MRLHLLMQLLKHTDMPGMEEEMNFSQYSRIGYNALEMREISQSVVSFQITMGIPALILMTHP